MSVESRRVYIKLRISTIKDELEDVKAQRVDLKRRMEGQALNKREAETVKRLNIYYAERIRILQNERRQLVQEFTEHHRGSRTS